MEQSCTSYALLLLGSVKKWELQQRGHWLCSCLMDPRILEPLSTCSHIRVLGRILEVVASLQVVYGDFPNYN